MTTHVDQRATVGRRALEGRAEAREQFLGQLRVRALPPAVPTGFVNRRRLGDQLTAGTDHPVTLISAGPGYGKTLTTASWVRDGQSPGRLAWLTVDETDNSTPALWADVLGALALGGAIPSGSPLTEVAPAAGFGARQVRLVAAGLAALPTVVTLVLDDFHRITDRDVLHSFGQLLEHQPPQLRIVLVTRSDPVLHLHRLRINGQVTDIRAADLAFTAGEAAELFKAKGFRLSAGQLRVLLDRTKGWAAGLRLALMALDPTDIDGAIARFSGSMPMVAEYLIEEVINRLPPADREFLLTISVPDRIGGCLANELTGDSDGQQVLERLAAQNALVVGLAGRNDWFSIHPMLREMLLHRLAVERPADVGRLNLLTCRWFASQGDTILAIQHASRAGAWSEVGRLAALALPLMVTPRAGALVDALAPAAARAQVEPSSATLLASAFGHYYRHDYESMVRNADDAIELMTGDPYSSRVMAEVVTADLKMVGARFRNPADVGQAAYRLLDLVERIPRRDLPAAEQYRVLARNNIGVWQLWSGDLAEAEQTLRWVQARSRELGLGLIELGAGAHLAVLEVIHGRLAAADRAIDVAQDALHRRGWASEPQALALCAASAMTHLERDELDAAHAQIAAGEAISNSGSDVSCELLLAIAAVGVAVARGTRDGVATAVARLDRIQVRAGVIPTFLSRWSAVARADAHLAAGEPRSAIAAIGRPSAGHDYPAALERVALAKARVMLHQPDVALALLNPFTGSDGPYVGALVEANVIAAVAADVARRDTAALTAIGDAIELAHGPGIVRPFRAAGPRLTSLITRYRHVVAGHPEFTAALTADSDGAPCSGAEALHTERLTERERAVLLYLPTMFKSAEIASDLYVTVNTVKSHQQSLYRKLGVTSRRQAVDRARELHLL